MQTAVDEDKITVAHSTSWTGEINEFDTDTDTDSNTDFIEVSEGRVRRAFTTSAGRVTRGYLRLDI